MPTTTTELMESLDALGELGMLAVLVILLVTEVLVVGAAHRRQMKGLQDQIAAKDRQLDQLWTIQVSSADHTRRLVAVTDRISS